MLLAGRAPLLCKPRRAAKTVKTHAYRPRERVHAAKCSKTTANYPLSKPIGACSRTVPTHAYSLAPPNGYVVELHPPDAAFGLYLTGTFLNTVDPVGPGV